MRSVLLTVLLIYNFTHEWHFCVVLCNFLHDKSKTHAWPWPLPRHGTSLEKELAIIWHCHACYQPMPHVVMYYSCKCSINNTVCLIESTVHIFIMIIFSFLAGYCLLLLVSQQLTRIVVFHTSHFFNSHV